MSLTKIIKVDPLNPDQKTLREAADILAKGGLVIIPTETVYGIAANMMDKKAVDRLYQIKKRPEDKPFSLHLVEKEKVEEFAMDIPVAAYKLMDKFWPGPLTLILKSKDKSKIGMRLTDDRIASRIILMSGLAIVCPSANISGKPAPVNFSDAIKDFEGQVDFAIDAGNTKLGIESSVVDLTIEPPQILREGAVKKDEIEKVVQKKVVLFVCTGNSCRSVMAKGLLEKKLKDKSRDDIEILSAGIMMLGGLGVTTETQELLRKEGIDVSEHFSKPVTKGMINKSDLILVMERMHEEKILQLAPRVKNRLFLLKEFAKIGDNNLDIADPIGKSREFYEQTFATIKEAIERVAEVI